MKLQFASPITYVPEPVQFIYFRKPASRGLPSGAHLAEFGLVAETGREGLGHLERASSITSFATGLRQRQVRVSSAMPPEAEVHGIGATL
jgi:hypothetical protein